jgi:CRP/FNR family transcriptional regulator
VADPPALLSPEVGAAWAGSFMAGFPSAIAERLLDGAREAALPAGALFYRGAHREETTKVGLVASGLLRTFRRSADGRQVTLRYAYESTVIGLPTALGRDTEVDSEALVDSRVLILDPQTFRTVAAGEASVAWAVAVYLAGVVAEAGATLSADLFLPVRSRVARHLLDMAMHDRGRLVVAASQQDLADAIGSVREVVARALRWLVERGFVERDGRRLVIRDAATLHRLSLGDETP